ncbi:TonB C-terminal domain-containing protein [Acinetobacter sp. ANC 4636]
MSNLKSTFQYLSTHLITLIILSSSHSVFAKQTTSILEASEQPQANTPQQTAREAIKQTDTNIKHPEGFNTKLTAAEIEAIQAWKNLYRRKIINAWNVPPHSSEQTAKVKIQLDSDGNVLSTEIQSNSKEMQGSIRQAILQSAPYPLPDAIQYRQFFYITFTAK